MTLPKGCSLIELFIVIAIIGVLASMSQPGCGGRRSRWQARQKACYSNIRVLTSAVEMYNMDVPSIGDMMCEMNNEKLKILCDQKYLKAVSQCPEGVAKYSSFGNISDDGLISCGTKPTCKHLDKEHGTIEGVKSSKENR